MHSNPVLLTYLPHGSNPNSFYPIDASSPDWDEFCKFRTEFNSKYNSPEFIVLFNSRNIRRKSPGDIILSFRKFCDGLPSEKAKKCCLIMKTSIIDDNGTDLMYVKRTVCPDYNVIFFPDLFDTMRMNWLYNISDVVIFLSSAEGFGLAANEGMLAGKMLISPVTGGLQDQMRFEDEHGNWVEYDSSISTNHRGFYKKHGEWAIPLFPSARVLNGSPVTPAIFDDYVDSENAAQAIRSVYDLSPTDRRVKGLSGRNWALSSESGMSSPEMCDRFVRSIDALLDSWEPPSVSWEMVKVDERPILNDIGVMWWNDSDNM